MRLDKTYTVKEIAGLINCTFSGDENHPVTGINEIHKVTHGDLVFVDHPKYYDKALKSAATTILIDKEVECPEGKALIISTAPFDDYNRLTRHFCPVIDQSETVGINTVIDPSAVIYPNVFIGNNVRIGKNSRILPGAVIMDRTIIGDHVIIGPNTTIGHNAFYYKRKPEGYDRMHTCGWVEIHDRVEIGANCTIDAGVSGNTEIGEGTKIDNIVHIGHDTVIGKNCLLAANVGLAGCVTVEDRVILWGQVGCASDIVIGEGAIVLAQSGIAKSLEGGKTYFGSPCGEVKLKFRELAALRRLPELLERM
ncbi:UDP-3-O-(3-hydroxymyristoyl)glucosamine N-acyltransferase [Crocinitomicaceae bacterium CZZ-1]|uniref:UDP-3-O-(3-hydroxymyristoyl)glucosamine N-acyltransferase n=1 Tax=Taishania pollutisoli TaxID=2766479 RepID=A0A8J6TSZ9_9FLAO|nr:LpxD N-terminal domain-containing protein [Taishania pollutisoli]MBC9812084.1 UDP-3-O-(3-hydroxymyristoyl)glucosamine N-acyltransferase [Taishania pollutisoli]MBX2949841.1 UDP-3-O-(3-hydroxymyristoyl)glucosamine N-acyltransferase [Crocinitomicaceae bacterium]